MPWRQWPGGWSPSKPPVCGRKRRGCSTRPWLQPENDSIRGQLAQDLAAVAGRLEPVEAARMCAEAAWLLDQALAKEYEGDTRLQLAKGLVAVLGRLDPVEGARLLKQALVKENDGDYAL